MAWQTPVTNWNADKKPAYTDFNRIEGNIAELKKAATIDIVDANNRFISTNVEGALNELYHICA